MTRKRKSIMVIGAGPNQLNLIRSAGEAGYRTVAIDPNEQAPGRQAAELFYCLAPDDFAGHCAIIEKHAISGIVTSQMEKPIQFMAQLAEKYGFAFISRESAVWARNKYEMKKRFLAGGVPCARGILLREKDDAIAADLTSLPFPLIMKPVDAYSSRGVFTIHGKDELLANFQTTAAFSSDDAVRTPALISAWMPLSPLCCSRVEVAKPQAPEPAIEQGADDLGHDPADDEDDQRHNQVGQELADARHGHGQPFAQRVTDLGLKGWIGLGGLCQAQESGEHDAAEGERKNSNEPNHTLTNLLEVDRSVADKSLVFIRVTYR